MSVDDTGKPPLPPEIAALFEKFDKVVDASAAGEALPDNPFSKFFNVVELAAERQQQEAKVQRLRDLGMLLSQLAQVRDTTTPVIFDSLHSDVRSLMRRVLTQVEADFDTLTGGGKP